MTGAARSLPSAGINRTGTIRRTHRLRADPKAAHGPGSRFAARIVLPHGMPVFFRVDLPRSRISVMELDALLLSRLQFAGTIMFHYLFPPLSIGLGLLMVIVEAQWLRTRAKAIEKRWLSAGTSIDVGDIPDRPGLRVDGQVTQAAQVL